MTVTLSKRTEERLFDEVSLELPSGSNAAELKSSLLAAVSKPTSPYRKGEFVELTTRVIAEDRSA